MNAQQGQLEQSAVEEFLSGKLAQVDVLAIERELRKLWQEAAAHESDAAEKNVARSCVLNLILYTRDHGAEITAGDLLDEIMLRHPCRALLAIKGEGDKPHIEAWVSARCHLAGAGSTKQICCEQIAVKSEGQGLKALPSVVIPLLVPDLPVFLLWRTGQFDPEELKPFVSAIDRLIFDSMSWRANSSYFKQASVFANDSENPALTDLNWRRVVHWRHLIAKSFDALSLAINPSDLDKIDTLRLEYVPPAIGQAALITGWLANQLKWRPLSATAAGANREIEFECEERNITVQWIGRESSTMPAGYLTKLQLGLIGERTLTVKLQLMDNKPSLACSLELVYGTSREVVGKGPDMDEPALVGKELDILERDRVFEHALSMAAQIVDLFP